MGAKNKKQGKTNANNQGKQGGKGGKGAKGAKGAKGNTKPEPTQKPAKVGGQQLNIRQILCEKKSKIDEAFAKLEGDNATLNKFDEVSRDYNEDKDKIGWFTKAGLEEKFVEVAWALELSEGGRINPEIAKTTHGYHIVIVIGQK